MVAAATEAKQTWYQLTPDAAAQELGVDPAHGLSAAEARQRLQHYGPNRLAGKKKESGLQAFLRQYQDFMQIILMLPPSSAWSSHATSGRHWCWWA